MTEFLITFEGAEGCGKSTQIELLATRLRGMRFTVQIVREPGGTAIGEEIRYTLKHSSKNHAMTAETELLMMNASRAQLVREVIRPALESGEIVLCDRFYDSTMAYQGYGRGLNLRQVAEIIDVAVGETRPALTFLLQVPDEVSRERIASRQSTLPFVRDRIEEADQAFFERVRRGYKVIADAEPHRVCVVDATGSVQQVSDKIWKHAEMHIAAARKMR